MDIKKIAKEKGYTMAKIAEELKINRVTLTQSLHNNPTLRTLQSVAKVLKCSVGDFFEDEKETNTDELTAFVKYKNIHYTADCIEELNKIVEEINLIAK